MQDSHGLLERLGNDKLATDIPEVAAMEPMHRARFEARALYQVYYFVAEHLGKGGHRERGAEIARMGEGVLRLALTLNPGMSVDQAKREDDSDTPLVERRAQELYPSVVDELSGDDFTGPPSTHELQGRGSAAESTLGVHPSAALARDSSARQDANPNNARAKAAAAAVFLFVAGMLVIVAVVYTVFGAGKSGSVALVVLGVLGLAASGALTRSAWSRSGLTTYESRDASAGTGVVPSWVSLVGLLAWGCIALGVTSWLFTWFAI